MTETTIWRISVGLYWGNVIGAALNAVLVLGGSAGWFSMIAGVFGVVVAYGLRPLTERGVR